jgi:hypothetical protein
MLPMLVMVFVMVSARYRRPGWDVGSIASPKGRSGNLQRSFAALGKLVLLGDALERLVDRLDAIEKIGAFGGKQPQDLVSARRERAAQSSRLVVD